MDRCRESKRLLILQERKKERKEGSYYYSYLLTCLTTTHAYLLNDLPEDKRLVGFYSIYLSIYLFIIYLSYYYSSCLLTYLKTNVSWRSSSFIIRRWLPSSEHHVLWTCRGGASRTSSSSTSTSLIIIAFLWGG